MARVGILGLQGAVREHADALTRLGANAVVVRRPPDLADLDAVVLPGGESTTMSMMLDSSEIFEPLRAALASGLPALGTCAGMILLANDVLDGRADQHGFATVDIAVRRNAWGRQVDSFEAPLVITGLDGAFPGVFIRAPRVERVGPGVEVLASFDGEAVLCRSGATIVSSFHPELADDLRIHQLFLQGVSP